jgi:hypothetical protein
MRKVGGGSGAFVRAMCGCMRTWGMAHAVQQMRELQLLQQRAVPACASLFRQLAVDERCVSACARGAWRTWSGRCEL